MLTIIHFFKFSHDERIFTIDDAYGIGCKNTPFGVRIGLYRTVPVKVILGDVQKGS